MNNSEFVEKLLNIKKYNTLYALGGCGQPLNEANKKQLKNQYAYNRSTSRAKKIDAATVDVFAFDCIGLVKSVLWGFNADKRKHLGGAVYTSNGVPDIGANAMIKKCSNVSSDFKNIIKGEFVWMSGHCGVYIGDGLVIESSPKWADGVQITACNQTIRGYNRRDWTKHGQLPYIDYKTPTPISQKPQNHYKGELLTLNKTPVYVSAYSQKASGTLTGTYFIYDGIRINGRYRVTVKASYVGRKPIGRFVTGFINE